MGDMVGRPDGKNNLEDLGVDGKLILNWIFKKWDGGHRVDLSGSGQGKGPGVCVCGNKLSGPIECEEFLDYLRTC
jgi:hypothetical protein